MRLAKCPVSKLLLPEKLIEEKSSLKNELNKIVDDAINSLSHLRENYFLTMHAKFDKFDPSVFVVSQLVATLKVPNAFMSNTMVFWINVKNAVCVLLWMVPSTREGEKPEPEFNKPGVAYLHAKGAMPSSQAM